LIAFMMTALVACLGCTYEYDNGEGEETPLVITALDVGQGLSVLLEWQGKFALYDMGPDSVGVLDTLVERGVDTLEWVVLSHYHRDHVGGFLELPAEGRPGLSRVHIRRLLVGTDTSGGAIRDSVARLSRRFDIPVDTLVRGRDFGFGSGAFVGSGAVGDAIGAATPSSATVGTAAETAPQSKAGTMVGAVAAPRFETLWPPPSTPVGENGASVVLRLEHGAGSALLTGDLDSLGERRLLDLSPTLSADLLQVGHHGSAGSSTLRFLAQVSPNRAFISAGKSNKYGHPTAGVLNKLIFVMGDSTAIYRTDLQGSVVFRLFPSLGIVQ